MNRKSPVVSNEGSEDGVKDLDDNWLIDGTEYEKEV